MLWHILAEYDIVLITGGVSEGKFDFLPSELGRQGVQKVFQGVAQRPGKPFWFGLSGRLTPVFALPGNPVSAYTCLHRYVLPVLDHASGLVRARAPGGARRAGRLQAEARMPPAGPGLERPAGRAARHALRVNSSGDFAGLVETDGFVELPAGRASFRRASWRRTARV